MKKQNDKEERIKHVGCMITDKEWREITMLCFDLGVKKSQILRNAVKDFLKVNKGRVQVD